MPHLEQDRVHERPGQAERLEAELWRRARESLAGFARSYGWTPELRALLSGVPLPAKANLKVRWARAADREAFLRLRPKG